VREGSGNAAVIVFFSSASWPWKKWPTPGKTITGKCCGAAHASVAASGTTSSTSPWMTSVSSGTLATCCFSVDGPTRISRRGFESGGRRCAASTATKPPNEKPARRNGRGANSAWARHALSTARASSTSPRPSSHAPSEAPMPRKLKRTLAQPSSRQERAIVCTTLLSSVPPNCGCGWQTSARPRGGAAGRSTAHSIAPAGPAICTRTVRGVMTRRAQPG
jgi:hypothetical protein